MLVPAFEEPILSAEELVGDECGHEVDGRHLLALGLTQPGFEDGRHARQAQFPEGVIEFDEIHSASPVVRSMRSR